MKATKLSAQIRDITGKKVKKIRKDGFVPVNVYGKGVTSQALQVPIKEFLVIYKKVGETGLVELSYSGESNHVLIKNVQFGPVTRLPIHAEFHAVNLKEKIKANIPLEFVGEAPAVAAGAGIPLQTLNEIEVEALPTDLPEKIEIDLSGLSDLDQQVVVAELKIPAGVEVLTNGEDVVVKIVKAVVEEVEEVVPSPEGQEGETDNQATEGETLGGETKPAEGAGDKANEKDQS